MNKKILDTTVVESVRLTDSYALIKVTPSDKSALPDIKPGQFVEVKIDGADILLRRPISVNFVDMKTNQLWLLVRKAGRGTSRLMEANVGDTLNLVLPLGNGFSLQTDKNKRVLLIGGGVGVAPLLYLGKVLNDNGVRPSFLIGARSKADLLQIADFERYGDVYISTDDGSAGEHGLVTGNTVLSRDFDFFYCCGPAPMMKAVARVAKDKGVECEVSLENMMACGLGACLCCVEKTVRGNVCVCTEGPVFNLKELTW